MKLTLLDRWAVASQQRARRNAMVATTRLTQLRSERREVEEYLAARSAPALPVTVAPTPPRLAAHR